MKTVTIVVLNWNGWAQTTVCLESINKIRPSKYHLQVVVVDNGSATKPLKQAIYKSSNIKLIHNSENLGFSQGNNIGIEYALKTKSDFIFLLNNDTTVAQDIVDRLLQVAATTSAGITGPKIYFSKGKEFHKDKYPKHARGKVMWYAGGLVDWNNLYGYHRGVDEVDIGQFEETVTVDYVSGAAMFIDSKVIHKIGNLDEKYFMYYEDLDFCLRAKRAGFNIIYTPKAIIWHDNSGSSRSGSTLQDYYISRNRLLFGMKYASLATKAHLLVESIKLALIGRPSQKKGVVDFFLGKFGKGF